MSEDEVLKPRYLTHSEPIWRDKANYLLMADIDGDLEQLWAREIGDGKFMICCVPLFVYDIALGDIVEADDDDQVTRVIERSGRYGFRIWLSDAGQLAINEILDELSGLGAFIERSSNQLYAIDAPDAVVATDVRRVLERMQSEGLFEYETGWL